MTAVLSRGGSLDDGHSTQREAILRAALELLRAEGAAGLRVRTVAAAAGCSTTGVYTWFGGKNGLVEAIYVEGFQRFGEALDRVSNLDDPTAIVRARAIRYREGAIANPTHYQVMFGGLVPGFEAGAEALAIAARTFFALADAVRAAMDAGAFAPDDPAAVAYHLWAGIHGYVELELAGHCPIVGRPADELYERGVDLLMSGVTAT